MLIQFQALLLHRAHIHFITGVAGQPQQGGAHGDQQGGGVGAALNPGPPALHPQIGAGDLRFGKDDLTQQSSDEVAAALAGKGAQSLPVQPERVGQRTHQPVNRGAFLGAAGEVRPPHQHALLESAGPEGFLEKPVGDLLQRTELLGKGVDQVAALGIAFILQAFHQPVIQPLFEEFEFGAEAFDGAFRVGGIVHREGDAPDLGARLQAHVVEKLDKPGD